MDKAVAIKGLVGFMHRNKEKVAGEGSSGGEKTQADKQLISA